MRILFYRHSLLNRGGDKMVVAYANYLLSEGHDVVITTNLIDTIFKPLVRIECISKFKYKLNTVVNAVFQKRNCDVAIADIIVMAALLSFRNKKKVLYFAQDYNATSYKNVFLKLFTRMMYFYCLTILKIPVIAVSDDLGRLLKEQFNAHVTVVKNGVNLNEFYPDKDSEYFTLKGNRKVILVFAQRDYRKGFDIVVDVLLKFLPAIERNELLIWSVGHRLEVPFPMTNFGFVIPETLRKILSSSDVLLYPSRHEGFGLFVLEALSCGCPVVTTEAVAFLTDRKDGLICKVDDTACLSNALSQVLIDQSLSKHISMQGLRTAQQYNLSEAKQQFHQVILEFVQES